MQVLRDAIANKNLIEVLISKYGTASEHNYYCYLYNIEEYEEPYIVIFDDGTGILAKYDKKGNYYRVFREIFCPRERTGEIVRKFLDHIYAQDVKPKKLWLELETETRAQVISSLKDSGYRVNAINYTLIWPVFEMDRWTGDTMQGGEWKDIRYYWNRFFKDHKVEFRMAKDVEKEEMKSMIRTWKDKRTGTDRAFIDYYMHAVEHDFTGYDINRIMIVDDKVAAISAGFRFKQGYYASIGLFNPDIERCNEIANMDDLINLKKLGIPLVDFGGVEKGPLEFKKKFRPTRFYKTHVFSIVLDNSKESNRDPGSAERSK
jgi:hypothetical protein